MRLALNHNSWAVVLAGGDGSRLRPLTRRIFGDDRPKQFCPIPAGTTLIAATRARLATVVPSDRTMYVVVKAHRKYYDPELSGVDASRVVVQPANKGTSAAIVYSLLRIERMDKEAIVGFFPTDHYYADEASFRDALRTAWRLARLRPDSLVLLAADADSPEEDYGWIEPYPRAETDSRHLIYRVNRFWEKPSRQVAQRLLEGGGLWNTFVMVGVAATFLEVLRRAIPDTVRRIASIRQECGFAGEAQSAARVYAEIDHGDFSRDVLSMCTDRLIALRAPDAGWSDLGTPARLAAVLTNIAAGSRTPDLVPHDLSRERSYSGHV